jgi:hypothetical protein
MKEKYETLSGKVALMYNKDGCRVFMVKFDLGNFKVIDYNVDPLDREIYWDNATHNMLNPASEEYSAASVLTDGYIHKIYEKYANKVEKQKL